MFDRARRDVTAVPRSCRNPRASAAPPRPRCPSCTSLPSSSTWRFRRSSCAVVPIIRKQSVWHLFLLSRVVSSSCRSTRSSCPYPTRFEQRVNRMTARRTTTNSFALKAIARSLERFRESRSKSSRPCSYSQHYVRRESRELDRLPARFLVPIGPARAAGASSFRAS